MQKFSLISFFCLVIPILLSGQAKMPSNKLTMEERHAMSKAAINELKEGVLVVRLSSNSKKLKELGKLADDADLSESKRERLEFLEKSTVEKTTSYNQLLMNAFLEHYDFSDIVFMLDTMAPYLIEGKTEGIFLNNHLGIDPNISINNRPYCITYFGKNPTGLTKSDVEGMVVMDKSAQLLPPPFPYFVFKLKSQYMFDIDYEKKYFPKMVKKFNRHLQEYHARAN